MQPVAENRYQIRFAPRRKAFDIFNAAEQLIVHFEHTTIWKIAGNATIGNNNYAFSRSSIWRTKVEASRNEQPWASIDFTWTSKVAITLQNQQAQEKKYLIQARGFWRNRYELIDKNNEEVLLSITPNSFWMPNEYTCQLLISPQRLGEQDLPELLLCAAYGFNYFVRAASESS